MLCCPVCPNRDSPGAFKPFPSPTGPKPCRVMLVGEGPSIEEYKRGRVFAGRTGQELDEQYLPMAGCDREGVYVTNASKCAGKTKDGSITNPTDEQARICSAYWLPLELREVQPEIVVPMGAIAVRAVVGEVDLEMQHGLPLGDDVTQYGLLEDCAPLLHAVVPTWHPAAGLHDTSWMVALQEDFRNLKAIIRREFVQPTIDCHPHPDYREAQTLCDIDQYFSGYAFGRHAVDWMAGDGARVWDPYAGVDTESDQGRHYCTTVSLAPGTGILVDAARPDLLSRLHCWLDKCICVFHAAGADLPFVPARRWVDTMEIAYWSQEFRIGLKILAYRLLGMRMREYNEIVKPPSKLLLHEYMGEVGKRMDEAVAPGRKGKSLTLEEAEIRRVLRKVKRLLQDVEKDFTGCDPWVRIEDWGAGDRELVEGFAGKAIPLPSVRHLEREELIDYACRDSDASLRLLPVLKQRAQALRRQAR